MGAEDSANPSPSASTTTPQVSHPTFRQALRAWMKVAALSFGGPAGQIAVMHRILVEERKWVSENRFLHALNYCMLLPGPEAQQLATYLGWLLHRTWGGLVAGLLFILPGFLSILLLSALYAQFRGLAPVEALFFGLKPAVMAVVVEAVIRIGRRTLKNRTMLAISATAFVAIFFFELPFPAIILAAALLGYAGGKLWPDQFVVLQHGPANGKGAESEAVLGDAAAARHRPLLSRFLRVGGFWLALWILPLIALTAALGWENIFVKEAFFFSKMAVVSFGGAYAVLAYVAQQAVETHHWLEPGEMLDGLGMAETTPGPLIQVVQFVGFMGAYRSAGELNPMLAGVLASIVVTWVTFVPCFLWIFLGAPYIEYLRGQKKITAALSAITAAVVGVILNLAVWFSLHVLFDEVHERHALGMRLLIPEWETLNAGSALIAGAAFAALLWFKLGMIRTLAGSVVVGMLYYYLQNHVTL